MFAGAGTWSPPDGRAKHRMRIARQTKKVRHDVPAHPTNPSGRWSRLPSDTAPLPHKARLQPLCPSDRPLALARPQPFTSGLRNDAHGYPQPELEQPEHGPSSRPGALLSFVFPSPWTKTCKTGTFFPASLPCPRCQTGRRRIVRHRWDRALLRRRQSAYRVRQTEC